MRQQLHRFDETLSTRIISWPGWLRTPFRIITFIGRPIVTIGVCMVIAGIAIGQANPSLFLASMVALGTMGVGTMIKMILQRDRPLTEYVANMLFKSSSFPSGHTLGSTVSFGLLAYIMTSLGLSVLVVLVCMAVVVLIIGVGLSRVYLGAHHPSDVAVGWAVGLLGLSIIIFIVKPVL